MDQNSDNNDGETPRWGDQLGLGLPARTSADFVTTYLAARRADEEREAEAERDAMIDLDVIAALQREAAEGLAPGGPVEAQRGGLGQVQREGLGQPEPAAGRGQFPGHAAYSRPVGAGRLPAAHAGHPRMQQATPGMWARGGGQRRDRLARGGQGAGPRSRNTGARVDPLGQVGRASLPMGSVPRGPRVEGYRVGNGFDLGTVVPPALANGSVHEANAEIYDDSGEPPRPVQAGAGPGHLQGPASRADLVQAMVQMQEIVTTQRRQDGEILALREEVSSLRQQLAARSRGSVWPQGNPPPDDDPPPPYHM